MAIARPYDWRKFAKTFLFEHLLSLPTLLWLALVLTSPYWSTTLIWLLLRSCLIEPNRIVVWAWACVGAVAFTWSVTRLFAPALRICKAQFAAEKRRRLGVADPVADENLSLQRLQLGGPPWRVFAIMASFLWLMPSVMTLALWTGNSSTILVKYNGRLRYSTPQEELRNTIASIEHHGIFTPL